METYQQELDGLDHDTVIRSFDFEERIQLKYHLLEKMSEAERLVHLINKINKDEGFNDQATAEQGCDVRDMSIGEAY